MLDPAANQAQRAFPRAGTMLATIVILLAAASGWPWWQPSFARGETVLLRAEYSRLSGKLRTLS